MSERFPYQYVVLRCVPRPDREEFLNVAVVLYCEAAAFLDIAWSQDQTRLTAVWPDLDLTALRNGLEYAAAICIGDERVGAAGREPLGRRFGFLKAPRSTVLQPGPVHGGVACDARAELARLADQLLG